MWSIRRAWARRRHDGPFGRNLLRWTSHHDVQERSIRRKPEGGAENASSMRFADTGVERRQLEVRNDTVLSSVSGFCPGTSGRSQRRTYTQCCYRPLPTIKYYRVMAFARPREPKAASHRAAPVLSSAAVAPTPADRRRAASPRRFFSTSAHLELRRNALLDLPNSGTPSTYRPGSYQSAPFLDTARPSALSHLFESASAQRPPPCSAVGTVGPGEYDPDRTPIFAWLHDPSRKNHEFRSSTVQRRGLAAPLLSKDLDDLSPRDIKAACPGAKGVAWTDAREPCTQKPDSRPLTNPDHSVCMHALMPSHACMHERSHSFGTQPARRRLRLSGSSLGPT